MVVFAIDESAQLLFVNRRGLRRALHLPPIVAARAMPARAPVAAWHVLPDEQAKFVRPIIPALGLYLHVFARHVEPELLRHLDVVAQRLVAGRGVKAIGPETLIER